MNDFDLNAFLAEQRAEGISEGGGEFTISHEKAAQKMSRYRLPREHAWALKFVQSAVAWGCRGIKLTQTRNHSTFTFYTEDPERLPSNQEIVSAILRADPLSEHPTAGFGAALRILVEKSYLSFLLRVDRGQEVPQAIYAGVHFSDMGEKNRVKQRAQWEGGLNLRIHHIPHTDPNRLLLNYIPVKDHALPILWELEEYAYLSPIPIIVDGRRIDGVLQETAGRWTVQCKPIRLCGFECPEKNYPPFEICTGFADQILSLYTGLDRAVQESHQTAKHPFYMVLSFSTGNSRSSRKRRPKGSFLYWIRDGVLVDKEKLNVLTRCLDLEVYCSAQGLSSDLTGFQLRRNEDFLQRKSDALIAVDRILELEGVARRDIFAQKQAEPQEPLETMGPLAKSFFALTGDLFQQPKTEPSWDDPLIRVKLRDLYFEDLKNLIETKSGEAPMVPQAELPTLPESAKPAPVSKRASSNDVSENGPSKDIYEGTPPQYDYDVKENQTFHWVPPDER